MSSLMRRASAVIALIALIVVATGCGSSSHKSSAKSTITTGKPIKFQKSLLGSAQSAGEGESYVPTGKIVADSGFRPDRDGFAFENYGNDAGPVNLTPANVEDIFGNQVCAAGTGKTCILIPSAKQWMDQENDGMAGGHCMGFSVSALRFFTKALDPAKYGANQTIALPVQGNTSLQSLIAENFSYQALPAVTDKMIEGSPTKVLNALVDALRSRNDTYTLGIFKADGTGGHAITPFAVEDRGNGQARILVYDNNFPGVIRKVDVNATADTWHYIGGINPSDTNEIYEGDARTQSMALLPTSPGEKKQPCPFCPKKPKTNPGSDVLVPDRLKYIEVVLAGNNANHPHMVFTDPQGRRTGYVSGRFLKEIPGVKVVQNLSVENWKAGAEPKFRLPLGHPKYTVTLDGSTMTAETRTNKITINGAGVVFYIQNMHIGPGQKDTMILPANDLGVSYAGTNRFPGSATLGAQFPQFDQFAGAARGKPVATLVTLATGWIGYKPGSPISLELQPKTATAVINTAGAKPLVSEARFVLSTLSTPLFDSPERANITPNLPLNPAAGDIARFHYLRQKTSSLPVTITSANGKQRRVLVPEEK